MKPISEQGYLVVAIDRSDTSYTQCAQELARSLKHWHPTAEICLLTNCTETVNPKLFRYQHTFPFELVDNAWANDWQAWYATPFRETIKLEADMIITSPIDHWWNMLRHRDVVVSTGCRDWKDQPAKSRFYRKLFDTNDLPDVYNAITYWRRSELAQTFFNTVKDIFENWNEFRKLLKFPEDVPSTDVVYAMAAKIVGPELCTMPFASYPKIVHMKKHIAGTQTEYWQDELVTEFQPRTVRINTVSQWGALHHGIKNIQL